MMAYNPYINNPFGSMYGQGYGYAPQQPFQAPQQQQALAQTQQTRTNIQFFTEEEIKAYVLMPNTQIWAMDKEKPCFYVKTADAVGRSTLNVFKYESVNENNLHENTADYATKSDLAEYATKQDIAELRSLIEKNTVKEAETDEH